ncbi:MAG: hypothetical protein AAB288_07780, partial [Acidobacteriota bacterium]
MKKLLFLAAVMCVFSITAFAQKTANFSGTWALDASKSKPAETMIESQTLVVTQTAADLKVERSTVRKAGGGPPAGGPPGGGGGGRGGMMGGGDGTTKRRRKRQLASRNASFHEAGFTGALLAPLKLVFALTLTFASFDWLMSLQPHWYSTIFGVYFFAGSLVGIFAFMALVTIA